MLANPETGEIVRAEPGESVFFRRDTWHHGFSYGDEPLRVLEFFAPPPATGTSGAYAQTQPYLEVSTYADDARPRDTSSATAAGAAGLVHACCVARMPSYGSTEACSSGCSSAPSTSRSAR